MAGIEARLGADGQVNSDRWMAEMEVGQAKIMACQAELVAELGGKIEAGWVEQGIVVENMVDVRAGTSRGVVGGSLCLGAMGSIEAPELLL